MDPLQWMGAVRMSLNIWKKHHNNPQVIHTAPVHQLMSWEVKRMIVRNKSRIVKFKPLLLSPVSIILLSAVKSCLIWIRREICTDQARFTSENSSKQMDLKWEMDLFTGRSITTDYRHVFIRSDGLKLKHLKWWICFPTNTQIFPLQDVNWWTGVIWITCE